MNPRWADGARGDSRAASSRAQGSTHPLEQSVQYLRGVGPQRAELLAELGIRTLGDLIEYFPFRHEFQARPQTVDSLLLDTPATVIVAVESVRADGLYGGGRIRAQVRDATGRMQVTWFNASWMRERLERGQILRLFGPVGEHNSIARMVNPRVEWLDPEEDPAEWNRERLVPVYRATARLTSPQIARLVQTALEKAGRELPDPVPADVLKERRLPDRRAAILGMHHPASMDAIAPARRRLAYEELFLMQLAITLRRRYVASHVRARALRTTPKIDERIRRRFPFALTRAQDRVIGQITADLARERPMNRLLQGDVGSGKTVVALYAALVAVANRAQCAIMAPTEVLAAQHFAGIEKYLAGSRVNRCLLAGRTTGATRRAMLEEIAAGRTDLVVGTQALLEDKVRFASLDLVIVDEQHKFGVSQRATMRDKSTAALRAQVPHCLVMTATPIPRTLSMTVFGDLDVSIIDQLPPGRQPIQTRLVRPRDEAAAWTLVRRRIAEGDQAYVVYPLVEESDALDLKAATAEVDRVASDLLPGTRVGLLHGRMKNAEKQAVMQEFSRGRLDALVSTTVIEVGVDVPNATVMVIQHAERYGLAALHQLRGRVGRGSKPSICLLLSDSDGETAQQRLGVLCATTDGFRIAEQDLKLRGPGELLGTRQHGWPEFRIADLGQDLDLLMEAREDAAKLVAADPGLHTPAHAGLRQELLRRFRDKVAFIDVA